MSKHCLHVIAILFAAVALLTACAEKTVTPANEVVIYTSVDQIYTEPIFKAFEEKSGVRVKAVYDVEAAKTTGLVARIEAEKDRPQADVFWNGEFAQTLNLAGKGLFEAYKSPSASDIPDRFKDASGYWASVGGRARIFLVNTDLLKPENYPTSLNDMLDARWDANTVGIANPLFGTTATQAAALYATLGAEKSLAFFKALRTRGVRVVDGNSVVRDMVVRGELAFGLTDTDDAASAIEKKAPVKIVAPDQNQGGTLIVPSTVGLLAGAPHPAQARALIDYLLSASTEGALLRAGACQPSVRTEGAPPVESAFASIKAMNVSLQDVQAKLPQALDELREVFMK